MLWAVEISLIAGGLLILQSVWALVDGIRFLKLVRSSRSQPPGSYTPFAAVVIPCRGLDEGFDKNLERFLLQDYPHYQVVFVVAAEGDSAYPRLCRRLEALTASAYQGRVRAELVVAGLSDQRGEKVNNLLRGVEAVDPSAQVLVFADIDAGPSPDWLRSLVKRLADPQATVSTGFRWYLPGHGFVSRLRAAWDTSIATMMGDHDHNFAWGGSMAIRATDFCKMGITERYWQSTVSDDYAVTQAVRDARGNIAFEPRCLVASQEESSLWDFLRWSTRQIIITRIYAAHLWKLGLAANVFYCGTFALGLVALAMPGSTAAERVGIGLILATVLLLGAGKGYIRTRAARELFGGEIAGGAACYWLLAPLVPWIMLANFTAAGLTRRIEWRGTEYELISRDKVRVVRRGSG